MGIRTGSASYILFTILCGIAYLLVFIQRFIPGVLGVEMDKEIGFGVANLAIFTSVNLYAYGLSQFPAGILIDRIGPRPVLTFSLLLSGVGAIFFGMSGTMQSLVLSRIIVGVGCAPILIAGLTLLAIRVPADKFPLYSTILYVFGGLGPLVGASPLAIISLEWGWRGACVIIGVFSILYGIIIFVVLKYLGSKNVSISVSKAEKKSVGRFSDIFKNKSYLLFLGIGVGIPSIYLVFGGLWASLYLFTVYDYDVKSYAQVLSWGAVGSVAGFLLSPLIALKIFRSVKLCLGIFGLALSGVLIVFMLPFNVSFYVISFTMFVLGFLSCGSQVVAAIGVKSMFSSDTVGKALGLYNMFPLVFGGLLQTVTGFIISYSLSLGESARMSYFYGFIPSLIICLFGGFCAFLSMKYKD